MDGMELTLIYPGDGRGRIAHNKLNPRIAKGHWKGKESARRKSQHIGLCDSVFAGPSGNITKNSLFIRCEYCAPFWQFLFFFFPQFPPAFTSSWGKEIFNDRVWYFNVKNTTTLCERVAIELQRDVLQQVRSWLEKGGKWKEAKLKNLWSIFRWKSLLTHFRSPFSELAGEEKPASLVLYTSPFCKSRAEFPPPWFGWDVFLWQDPFT